MIVTVARLTPGKQIDLCIQVHARLKSAGVHFRWYVIGSGSEEETLRRLIRDQELESDFHLLGPQSNVHACLQAADVFALFSASEGCPTVILEAITLGLPVITTAVHGADEMIEHEQTGIIVRNQLEDIVRELRRLVEDESLRQRLRSRLAEKSRTDTAPREWETLPRLLQEPKKAAVPRVSILIPTYNQQQFLSKAIVSALDQDYAALEVVLLDDASTDDTEQLARAWLRDPRFRYVRNPQNRGRVANYHHGLYEVVRGEWVLVLDGDDFLTDSGFIRNAMAALTRNADRSILFAQAGHRVHYLNGERPDMEVLPPIGRQRTGGRRR